MRRDREPAGLPEAVAADWDRMKVFISPLSLAHHSDYAESFTGFSCNYALTAVELGIIRDSA